MKNCKKMISLLVSLVLLNFTANAEFFSIKLGEDKSTVEEKLSDAGFSLELFSL